MKSKLIPKHQTPNQPLVLSQDNTRVESPYVESIPITETALYKQYLADPYRNTDFNTWKKRQELIQSSRKDEKVKANNRSSKVKEQETKQGKAIHNQQQRKELESKVNKGIWTGIGLGGLALAQATPAAPYIDAALAANGIYGLAKQADEGTLGLNLETGLNTLQVLPFGIRGVKKGVKYTDDLIKLLGNKKDPLPFKGDRNGVTKEFAEYLQKLGVDVNRFTNKDLILLQNMRRLSILDNIPANLRVITLAELNYQPNKYVEYYLRENNEILGELNTANLGKVQHIQNIKSYNPKKHNVSRDLYDAALNYLNRGVISGEILHSPEQTIHIWNKYYPKRKLISTDGVHTYNFGENIAKSGERYTVTNGPVVDLKLSWGRLPMKSQTIFHPKIIDKNTWTLKAPNWNDKNIYTALIPIGYFLSTNQSNR